MKTIKNEKATVRFAFKDPIKELQKSPKKESLIFLHFSFPGGRMKYSTGYKSCYSDWNFDKQRIKTNKSGILNAGEVNEFLVGLETNLTKGYSRLIAENLVVSKEVIRGVLDNLSGQKEKLEQVENRDFWSFIDQFLQIRKKQVSIFTLRAYSQTIARLKEYQKRYKKNIEFETIDINFYHEFCEFLEDEGYALNTIGKHIKHIKVFMSNALLENYTSNVRFKGADFKVPSEQTTTIYLSEEEIELLRRVDLSGKEQMEKARDIFLIGCYTGQRVSDYNNLSAKNLVQINGSDFIKIKQKKTGKTVDIPITREIREVFRRYEDNPPPRMSEQKINLFIKQVGKMAGLKDSVTLSSTKGGKFEEIIQPKYFFITTHTARRSFCTNKYKKGKRPIDIMFFSGHSTEKEFLKYIRIQGEERASHLVQNGFFE